MSLIRKQILAVSLAALSIAALIVTIYLTARSADSLPANSPLLRDLVPVQVAQAQRPARLAPDNRPPAFRVDTVTIPAAAPLPDTVSLGPTGSTSGLPQPSMPELVRPQWTAAIAIPQTAGSPAAAQSPPALDIALHPSLKYANWVARPPTASLARSRAANAAFKIPVVSFGDSPKAPISPSLPTATPAIADSDSPEMQPLIEASLKMESARRFVRSLCVDHCQRLWVASEQEETENPEGGVECFDQSAPQLHQWTQFTIQDGLGDDKATAVACDHEGRIWVGHSGNHGVSVYNGQRWQNYSNVAIPTGPSSLLGPLGETVAHIAVSPLDGDIWIATDCGLTRYSDSKGTWTIYGLPAGQATSLAFDRKGNIYAATKNDGIAMASAADNYQSWRRATAPDTSPMTTSGSGLPSNSINDILAAEAGTIYAATDAGLAWSKDDGGGWQFIRGWDGAEKIRRQGGTPSPDAGQPQTGSDAPPSVVLAEDYCSCLAEVCAAESLKGQICIGHRQSGVDLFDPPSNRITNVTPPTFARAFAAAKETFVGSYGPQHHAPYPRPGGVIALDVTANERAAPRTAAGLRLAGFPSGAPPVGNQLLQPEIELGNLKNLYLAGHFEELLSRCKRAERDQRYADRQPQLLYLEWVTDRTLGNSPESDQVEAIFLQRYPRQAFAAEIYYAEALELLANGRYKAANDKFATIVTYFPQSALAAKSIEIRDRLLLSTARPLERIWPIFERRGARGPLAQHN